MEKEITISYEVNNSEVAVLVSYKIELNDDIQTISCMVNPGSFNVPQWLQLRKFELKSILSGDGDYMPIFTDNENIKNINAVLFIDKAYNDIMRKEKFKMSVV